MIGTVLGNYKILEKLGEGGMGTVYRAIDQMVERNVAIKVLRPEIAQNPEVVERFRSEAIALARLNHAAIATLYSFFREGSQYFMAMEFVPGETLEKRIQRQGAFPWQQAVEILLSALDGVRHAHEMGILHRDLKPANIMITPNGRVKVTDFGIARVLNTVRLTREARIVGTLEYLAPERALGRPADARSDLYSLGVVFYEMLTGRLPFQADSDFALMRAQIEQVPQPPREIGVAIPAVVEAALMKALAKDPEDRYPDAATFASAFREAVRATGLPLASIKATRLAQEKQEYKQPEARSPKLPIDRFRNLLQNREARMAAMVAAGLLTLGAVGLGAYKMFAPKPPVVRTNIASNVSEPLSVAPSNAAEVQPIAPPVVIPAQPAAPDAGAGASSAPAPGPSAPAPMVSAPPRGPSSPPRSEPPSRSATTASAPKTETILAALDDGGTPGSGPLHFAGILKALRTGGASGAPVIAAAVQSRGVDFQATPDQLIDLKTAGASDALLHVIISGYRADTRSLPPAPVGAIPSAPSAPPRTEPVPTAHVVRRLHDVRRLYIVPTKDELDDFLKEDIRSELGSAIAVTDTAGSADASLQVEVQDEHGNRVVGTAGRIFGLKGKRKAIVKVVDPRGRVLWTAEAGSNKAVLGAFGDGARRLASRIARQLREDWDK